MYKMMLTVLAVVFCMTATLSASAEEARPSKVSTTTVELNHVRFDSKTTACLQRCQQGSERDCRISREAARASWRRLLARLDAYERRIAALERRIEGVGNRADQERLERALQELRERVDRLTPQLRELAQLIARLTARMTVLEGRVNDLESQHQQDVEALNERIERLTAEIERVARRVGAIQLSVTGGFLGMYALDGSSYTGGVLGLRVAMRVTNRLNVFAEPMVGLSYSELPVSTTIRGGLLIELAGGRVMLETAVSGTWVELDQQLSSGAAYITFDVGASYRPIDLVGIRALLSNGIELDQCNPSYGVGGFVLIDINIPRL